MDSIKQLSDPYVRKHLTAWLEEQVRDDRRHAIADAMVAQVLTDEEYYSSQGWWKVYDDANCNAIERMYNECQRVNYDAFRGEHYI